MPEQQNIEWKQLWRDEYLQWISGFANTNGGILYIGKDDKGNIVGVDKYKKLMDELPNKISSKLGVLCDVNLYEENNLYYMKSLQSHTIMVFLVMESFIIVLVVLIKNFVEMSWQNFC